MQLIRTLLWVLLLVLFVALTVLNWAIQVQMVIWPGLVWDTRLPAIVVAAFLLGFIPMWLLHRASRWRAQRRMSALETATARMAVTQPMPGDALGATPATPAPPATPVATPIQPPAANPAPPSVPGPTS